MPIRVMIVAAHELSAAATRDQAIAVVAEAQPDVSVLDEVPADGAAVVRELAAVSPVIVIARDEAAARAAVAAGARGVVDARQSSAELLAAVRAGARGEASVPSWADGHASSAPLAASHPLARLTPRERQVFERLIQGDSNPMIARRLGISPKTVDTHRMHVMRKIGVHSIVQLVRFAARHQLLPPDAGAQSVLA